MHVWLRAYLDFVDAIFFRNFNQLIKASLDLIAQLCSTQNFVPKEVPVPAVA